MSRTVIKGVNFSVLARNILDSQLKLYNPEALTRIDEKGSEVIDPVQCTARCGICREEIAETEQVRVAVVSNMQPQPTATVALVHVKCEARGIRLYTNKGEELSTSITPARLGRTGRSCHMKTDTYRAPVDFLTNMTIQPHEEMVVVVRAQENHFQGIGVVSDGRQRQEGLFPLSVQLASDDIQLVFAHPMRQLARV